ncbi:sulfotransferase [Thermomonas sp. HDW16]|uniref:tetratricopeptide repeat-containing sulfotransferase family protein n=1 Tax=Thermomonas sp. HDW16 TaxID=2714945 RepID=UPI00140BC60B|nr:sulfotransferase [Thermomonas sp. HDW16]QIL19985.1 hypothetical protein G7079_04135 [Thermomonas sp. HDW16]
MTVLINQSELLRLSSVESSAGNYRAAREYVLRASAHTIRNPVVARQIIERLRVFNEVEALKRYLHLLGPIECMPIPLLLSCAAQFVYLGELDNALRYIDEARRGDPEFPPTLLARGQTLMYHGRFDEARAEVMHCLKRAPELAHGWWLLSRIDRQTEQSNHVAGIRAQLHRPGRRNDEIALLQYALHKELDDLGDYDGAWRALEQACRRKRETAQYDVEDNRRLFDDLIAFPVAQSIAGHPRGAGATPLFIVGMHRSGTTLLEQLLDGSPNVKGIGEVYDFASAMRYATNRFSRGVTDRAIVERAKGIDFTEVGKRYQDSMAWRLGDEQFFTDKLPSNFLNIGFICRALPHAKMLHMVRDPVETCFSNLRELFSDANPYSYSQMELAEYYLQYHRLMAHWHGAYPGRILDVQYADLARDPETVMRKVADFCGVDFVPEMADSRSSTRAVATASSVQVRQSVTRRDTPRYVPYLHQMQPLIEALRGGLSGDA